MDRRLFLVTSSRLSAGLGIAALGTSCSSAGGGSSAKTQEGSSSQVAKGPLFEISLAQWSFHKALRKKTLDHLDFAAKARSLDISGIEYVNSFFKGKAEDAKYLAEMNRRAADQDVKSLLIMCDGEGNLGDPDATRRSRAIDNHKRWVTAAKTLGCHSIRVNARSGGSYAEQMDRAADGLGRLTEFAATHEINVIVENHGGLSSNGAWLAGVMAKVDMPGCGTLPDFGNFRVSKDEMYDRYKGVAELMPYAKAVSAKAHEFDAQGNEVRTDYRKMMKIVIDAGYRGFVGIEYEGSKLTEEDGVIATRRLLETVRAELS